MPEFQRAGFIGLGVMGEPICRNLAVKGGVPVLGCDNDPSPLQRLAAHNVTAATAPQIMRECDVVFLSLPSGEVVAQLARGADGLLANARSGQLIVDLSTSPVDVTRELAGEFAAKGATLSMRRWPARAPRPRPARCRS